MSKKENHEPEAESTVSLKNRMNKGKKELDIRRQEEARMQAMLEEAVVSTEEPSAISAAGARAAKDMQQAQMPKNIPQSQPVLSEVAAYVEPIRPTMKETPPQVNIFQGEPLPNSINISADTQSGTVMAAGAQPLNINISLSGIDRSQMTNTPPKPVYSDEKARENYEDYVAGEDKGRKKSVAKSVISKIVSYAIRLVLIAAIVIVAKIFLITIVPLSGESMAPTYNAKDKLVMEMVSYYIRDPEIGDIAYIKLANGTNIVKRVVGVPGDKIQIKGGSLYRNGIKVEDSFGQINEAGIAAGEITLGYDEYFVLGDNRNNSQDSRNIAVGVIDRDLFKGKIWFRLWPIGGSTPKADSEQEAIEFR